jgi:hypothetical protein
LCLVQEGDIMRETEVKSEIPDWKIEATKMRLRTTRIAPAVFLSLILGTGVGMTAAAQYPVKERGPMPTHNPVGVFAHVLARPAIAGLAFPAPASGSGDIICSSTQQRFLLPKDCFAPRVCGSGLKLGYCQLAPQSPGLARVAEVHADGAGVLAQLYDNSVLRGMINGRLPLGAACQFVLTMFTPYKCTTDFAVSTAPDAAFYALFGCEAVKGTGNTLQINPLVFTLSPALLARSIGHEMVHADQCARHETYGKTGTAESRLNSGFEELEAYSWEAGEDSFPRTFKVKATELNTITPDEEQQVRGNLECADWTVKEDLANMIIRHGGAPPQLRDYLNSDPWVKSVWLPNNPNWQHQQPPGPMPKACGGSRMGL